MANAHLHGIPIIRPAFFHDATDPQLRTQEDAFMVGESLFIAPILEAGAVQRKVYLPSGMWYDFWNGTLIDGAREITVEITRRG